MKTVLATLKIGEVVTARVEELLADEHLIVNFNGDLVRVNNLSRVTPKVGESVRLRVIALNPISFQLAGHGRPRTLNLQV